MDTENAQITWHSLQFRFRLGVGEIVVQRKRFPWRHDRVAVNGQWRAQARGLGPVQELVFSHDGNDYRVTLTESHGAFSGGDVRCTLAREGQPVSGYAAQYNFRHPAGLRWGVVILGAVATLTLAATNWMAAIPAGLVYVAGATFLNRGQWRCTATA